MTVSLQADKAIATSMSAKDLLPALTLLCHDKKGWLGLSIGGLNTASATLRFDRDPAISAPLHHQTKIHWFSSNRQQVVDPNTYYFDKPGPIVTALLGHQSLLLHVTPENRPIQETTFTLAGFEPLLASFEAACGVETPFERPAAVATGAEPAVAVPKPAASPPSIEKFGEWRVSRSISKIDDGPIVILSLAPADPLKGRLSMLLRCREKKAEAYLAFASPLFAPPQALMVVQASVDGGSSKDWMLTPSTEGRSFFFSSAPQLLKRLLASKELKLVLGPQSRKTRDNWIPEGIASFALAGLDQASKPYVEACGLELATVKVKDGLGTLP